MVVREEGSAKASRRAAVVFVAILCAVLALSARFAATAQPDLPVGLSAVTGARYTTGGAMFGAAGGAAPVFAAGLPVQVFDDGEATTASPSSSPDLEPDPVPSSGDPTSDDDDGDDPTGDDGGADGDDDTATPPGPLSVVVTPDRATAAQGDEIHFLVSVTNTSDRTLRELIVETHVPSGTTATTGTVCTGLDAPGPLDPGCEEDLSGGVLAVPGSDESHVLRVKASLDAGEELVWELTVWVDQAAADGSLITQHAHAQANDVARVDSDPVVVEVV